MVDSASAAPAYAFSAIAAADVQIASVTDSLANQIDTSQPTAPFGASVVAAPPVTGTQPSSAASQVFQALQSSPIASTGTTQPSVSRAGAFDISYQPTSPAADSQGLVARPNLNPVQQSIELTTAANTFAANVQSLQTTNQINHRILDLTT